MADFTLRFALSGTNAADYDAIPAINGIRITPAVIDPGQSIGQRETVSIDFVDFLYKFDVEAFTAGTFWSKFRARFPTLEGLELRILRGEEGAALEELVSTRYVIDSYQYELGRASIIAKDPLKLLEEKAAQAPGINSGEISSDIAAGDGSLTLVPTGIGDAEYPASGRVVLGGEELCSFTRSGDTVTLTTRGENTAAKDHDAGTKVQVVLEYDGATPSEIISDLLTNYTTVDAAWITIADWQTSVDDYIARVYSAKIVQPESVKKLLDELCEQVGLIMYWDGEAEQVRLKPLVPVSAGVTVDADSIMAGSYKVREQPRKRISQVWTHYAQRDPTKRLDEVNNYARIAIKLAENAGDYSQPAIKKIFSRWIPFDASTTAERLNDMQIARYSVPPRKFSFDLFRSSDDLPKLGTGLQLGHWSLVDAYGVELTVPAHVIAAASDIDLVSYEAEEMRFSEDIDDAQYVVIDANTYNVNLRELFDNIYSTVGEDVVFVIETGITVGSERIDGAVALDVGDWPEEPSLTLIINGRVQGYGGDGGYGLSQPGEDGGDAIYTRVAITIENNGQIYGGGGGGGGGAGTFVIDAPDLGSWGAGGGGAGTRVGYGTDVYAPYSANSATADAGGTAVIAYAGNGGDPGQPGEDSLHGISGGAAGNAVDGDTFVTFSTEGTIAGPRIN